MFSHLLRNANFNRLKNFICKFPYSKFLNGNIQCNFSNQSGDTNDGTSKKKNSSSCGGCEGGSSKSIVPHKSLKPPANVNENVFRKFECADEKLGPGADKCGNYKNPEYYGYHSFSYSDFLIEILKLQVNRQNPCPVTNENLEEEDECEKEEEEECTSVPEAENKDCVEEPPARDNVGKEKSHNPKCKCEVCKCEVCKCGEKEDKQEKKDSCDTDSDTDDDKK